MFGRYTAAAAVMAATMAGDAGGGQIMTSAEGAPVVLVERGMAVATIVLPDDAAPDEQRAAAELQEHVRRMSGAELPVGVAGAPLAGVQVLIGRAAPQERILAEGADPASFHLRVAGDTVALAGRSAEGTLFAAYELLEQLGVRWFLPGELGTVVPPQQTLAVAPQDRVHAPAFAARLTWGQGSGPAEAAWFRRQRAGGPYLGAHGIPCAADPRTEPELFCAEHGRPTHQLRVSHPEVLRRTIAACREQLRREPGLRYLSMGPEDGAGFGTDPWDAGDLDPLNGRPSVTDRYIRFFNLVLAELQQDYPEVGLAFYAYSDYMRPPVRERPNARIVPVLAPIDCCRLHGLGEPHCWERHHYFPAIVAGWRALGVQVSWRGYLGNLADPGLPFSPVHQVRAEFPFFRAQQLLGVTPEYHPMWSYHAPGLYLAARLAWDPAADAEAVVDEYCRGLYGPAAAAMTAHFACLERAFAAADHHTGNIFDYPHILTPAVRRELATTLAAAEQAVPADSDWGRRVRLTRLGFDFGEAMLDMVAALNACDFATASSLLARLENELLPAAAATTPPALDPSWAGAFLARFWAPPVREGYARVTGGNELAVRLPDTWMCLLDPAGGGEALGCWRPETGTAAWLPLRTWSRSWSGQGLRYYRGDLWYRTTAPLEPRFRGRRICLWLAGVDDRAAAWINGKPLPVVQQGDAPIGRGWEFDATDAVVCGADNTIVVRTTNSADELHEIGTGGITGPAMLWASR